MWKSPVVMLQSPVMTVSWMGETWQSFHRSLFFKNPIVTLVGHDSDSNIWRILQMHIYNYYKDVEVPSCDFEVPSYIWLCFLDRRDLTELPPSIVFQKSNSNFSRTWLSTTVDAWEALIYFSVTDQPTFNSWQCIEDDNTWFDTRWNRLQQQFHFQRYSLMKQQW